MQLKEILKDYEGEDIEVYKPKFSNDDYLARRFHTDFIEGIDDYTGEEEVITWDVMNREDYDSSVLANCGMHSDEFMEEDDTIVCILIEKEKSE